MVVVVFIVCLAASTIGGICGIGGGVIIKPVLDAMNLMSVSAVSFLSACTVLSMSLVSVFRNRKNLFNGEKSGLLLGIGAAIGGVIGKLIFDIIKAQVGQDAMIKLLQAIILGLLTVGTFIYTLNKPRIRPRQIQNTAATIVIGLSLGMVSSFLGIGGGPFNLVVLHYFFAMDSKKAAQNSLLIVLLSQIASLLRTFTSGGVPAFDSALLCVMVLGGVLGGLLGSFLNRRIFAKQREGLYAALFLGLLAVIFGICVYNAACAIQLL